MIAALLLLLCADAQDLRERVARSVVAIEVQRDSDPDGQGAAGSVAAHRDYLNRPRGPTSGVIYEADGFILTSYFNVSGGIRKNGIKVTLWDGRECAAELTGFHEGRDIALLKIDATGLSTLPKADLASLGQGSFVAVVGRSPDKTVATINMGILSAMNRMNKAAVQTDAEMNYGNAGGALVTLKGELVGVGCNVKPRAHWGQSGGIGFACKVAEIDALLDRLKKGEKTRLEIRPFLGIGPGEGDPATEGLQVGLVDPGSPAQKAGIQEDDVIVEFDGKKAPDFDALRARVLEHKIGDEVTIKIKRRNAAGKIEERELKVKLEGRAEE